MENEKVKARESTFETTAKIDCLKGVLKVIINYDIAEPLTDLIIEKLKELTKKL